jgi:AraC-like DNA-binding protein
MTVLDYPDVRTTNDRLRSPWSFGSLALADASSPDTGAPRLQRLSANDVETATSALSTAYCEVTVLPKGVDERLQLEVVTCALPNVTVGRIHVSSLSVRCGYLPVTMICLPISEEVLISSHGHNARVGGQSAAVISSGSPVAVEYQSDDSRIETLVFEQSAIDAELVSMLGMPMTTPLRFDSPFSLSGMSPLSRALSLLHHELTDPNGLIAVPAMSSRLGRLVIAALLVSQPHNYTEELTKPKTVRASKPIRNALEYIESRPAEIETVADIAATVGLSVRALDDGFRRYVGTPPMTYLRDVRITRAHAELKAAEPDMTTATAVARKWGFGHYGRFAADYRRRFGRKPSETLRETTTHTTA